MDSTTTATGTATGTASYTINPPRQYGWVCPLCGRANAPWLSQCPCQPKKTWTFISPTTDIKDDITWSDYRATNE